MRNNATLTDRGIRALKPGRWATDATARGAPCLQGRKLADGSMSWYLRYSDSERRQVRIPLGVDLSLADARRKANTVKHHAESLRQRYPDLSLRNDLRGLLRAEETELAESARKKAEAEAARFEATFGKLLSAYVEDLQRRQKIRWREVETSLERNIRTPWPSLIEKPAADITLQDLLIIIRSIVDSGRLREAAKVRSYLRAAYTAAVQAGQSADATPSLAALHLTTNPARDLATIAGANQIRERALSISELQAYWARISHSPLLQFHLLTGGQRIDQLRRLTVGDRDVDAQTVIFRDPKGRREQARVHAIPLLPQAQDALDAMLGGQLGSFLWTLDAGKHAASYTAARDTLAEVVRAMMDAGETSEPFTLGDLRRTVETRLAGAGVSRDIRAQLQSHGLGGVQQRHYDRHTYLDEKRAALETLKRLLVSEKAQVIPIASFK